MKSFDTKMFCEELLALRGDDSQQIFSEKLGINRSTLSLLETGKQLPTLDMLNKICTISGKNPGDYFVEADNDGLIYLMGSLDEQDRNNITKMIDRIKVREKYELIAGRCLDDVCG